MNDIVNITAVGDISFSRDIEKYIKKNNYSYNYPLSYVKKYFKHSDLTIANLENPITDNPFICSKKICLKSDPKCIKAIVDSDINLVNLANNHINDCGIKGLNDTLNILEQNNILTIGTESKPYIIKTLKNIRLGFIGISNKFYPKDSLYAKNVNSLNKKYILNKYNENIIKKLRKKVDILIVSIHWGQEYHKDYNIYQKNLSYNMIEKGVDIILGHHPHVIQSMEYIKTKNNVGVVFYSLGNFLFDSHKQKKGVRNTYILNIEINIYSKKIKFSYLPCIIYPNKGYSPIPLNDNFDKMYPKFSSTLGEKLYKYTKCSKNASCNTCIENFYSGKKLYSMIPFIILLILFITLRKCLK